MTYALGKSNLNRDRKTTLMDPHLSLANPRSSLAFPLILLFSLGSYCLSPVFAGVTRSDVKAKIRGEVRSEVRSDLHSKVRSEITPEVDPTAKLDTLLSDKALYEAMVPAPAPQDGFDDQPTLIQQAFKDMLIRLSGTEKIISHVAVVKALAEVDNYVKQFSFHIDAKQERVFKVRFDDFLCRELLKNAGQPLLGAKRPPVVLWLAMQQDNVTQWVGGDIQNDLSHQLAMLAEKRGLTLVYPLLDLTDTALVSEQQVWNEDLTALQAASKRYNADHILIGKLNKQPSGWYAQWTYVKEGKSIRWDMSNTELTAVFGEALDEFSNRLATSDPMLAKKGTGKTSGSKLSLENRLSNASDLSDSSSSSSSSGSASSSISADASGSASTSASLDSFNSAEVNTPVEQVGVLDQPNNFEVETSRQSAKNQTLRLAIVGVRGDEQYAKVLKYLKSLPAVREVEVAEITPEQTVFNLDITSSREAIMDSIAAGQLLTENTAGSLDTLDQTETDISAMQRDTSKIEDSKAVLNYKLMGMLQE